jgi:serine protease
MRVGAMRGGRGAIAALVAALLLLPVAAAASPRAEQWGLERIRAPEAWDVARGAETVVAVLDTGVHLDHPDLAPRLLRDPDGQVVGLDLVDGGQPHDGHGHGTLVAGVIAAAIDRGVGGAGISGVAPEARLMPVRVLDDRGNGRISDVDRGIRWAVDRGADVVNLSLESSTPLPGDLIASGLDDAVRYAWDRGVVVVAAAGNSGTPFTDYRSSTPVLLVGATDQADRRAGFSDGGRSDMVMAPGVDVVSTACRGPCGPDAEAGYGRASGTSFAAPHVAGAVAVLRSAGLSPAAAVDALRSTAAPVSGGTLVQTGHGRIDLAAAVGASAAAPSRPTPTPTTSASPAPDASSPSPSPDPTPSATSSPPPSTRSEPSGDRTSPPSPSDEGVTEPTPATADTEDVEVEAPGTEDAGEASTPGETRTDPVADLGAVDVTGPEGPRSRLRAVAAGLVLLSSAALVATRRRYGWG